MRMTSSFARGIACLGAVLITSAASAAVSKVICVPWQGDVNKQHTVIDGIGATIKAVVKTSSADTIYYKWNYGDGNSSAVLSASGNTWYNLESSHTYAGASGTPFTATLTAADSADLATNPKTDNYLLKIEDNTLDARINLAIDIGLWYTFKQGTRADGVTGSLLTMDGMPFVYWNGTGRAAASASAVQAFEINGSKESGNFDQDPYAEYVALGLKFLIMGYQKGSVVPAVPAGCTFEYGTVHANLDFTSSGVPAKIYFEMLDTACGGGGTYQFYVNGVNVGTSTPRNDCSCGPGTHSIEVSGAALTAAWGATAGKTLRVTYSGGIYISRVTAVIDLGGGTLKGVCLQNFNNAGCFDTLDRCNGFSGIAFDTTIDLSSVDTVSATTTECHDAIPEHVEQLPILRALTIGLEHGDNPDSNGNGIGIEAFDGDPNAPTGYQTGLVMDAIIASGTPAKNSEREFVSGHSATYGEIIQDMTDMYAWGQYNGGGSGSWIYQWNNGNDNSAAQWAAIGMIPAQEAPWNATVPQWVKTYDNAWLNNSFYTDNGGTWGHFGYQSSNPLGCGFYPCPNSIATTPSGMVQLSFSDMTTADSRWEKSERWIAENWDTGQNFLFGTTSSLYSMYALTKAMRLAKPAPVVNFTATGFDWYRGSAAHVGVAKALSDNLIASANGSWSKTGPYYWWENQPLATEWAVIMLRPTLFAAGPIACFTAHPNPSFANQPIAFDPGCSGHSDPAKSIANLKKFEWDWDNNGTYDLTTTTPDIVNHSFSCPMLPCTYPVKLRVTDDAGLTATFVLDIEITIPPHPPVSKPGGPYIVSLCPADTLTLDGSASFDPDEGQHQAGCGACPNDTITAYDWDLDGAPFNYDSKHGKTVALGTAFTTYFASAGSYNIGLKVTDNTKLAYPGSGEDNLDDEAFGVVQVYAAGPCALTATPGCQTIKLDWDSVSGATKYDVYRSTTGPNVGFASISSTAGLTFTDSVVSGTHYWYRILATKVAAVTLSPAVASTDDSTKCLCVKDLKPIAKNVQVQLNWTKVAGASCYNVYRSTSPNVALVAGNRVATCVGAVYALWVDTNVVNGTKYYYKVTEVVSGSEVCNSAEVSVTPNRR